MDENERIEDEELDDLDEQRAELLPDREAMSTISLDPVIWDLPVEPRDGV